MNKLTGGGANQPPNFYNHYFNNPNMGQPLNAMQQQQMANGQIHAPTNLQMQPLPTSQIPGPSNFFNQNNNANQSRPLK
jgi:hypothetical protein